MNPVLTYIKNLFAFKKILGNNVPLHHFVKADTLLQDLVNEKKVPGLAISVMHHEAIIFQKGYGYADIKRKIPVHPVHTIFRVASVSKPIAATALAVAVNEGLIDLDTSFYSYVPYFPPKKWDFTIRQLASHTAGIRSYKGKEYALNQPLSIKEGIKVFKNDALLFEPGTDYLYSSFDWTLISLAIEEASGVPFEHYVKEKVLQPLHMNHTFAPNDVPEPLKNHEAIGYTKTANHFRKAVPVNNTYKLAGGGYLSTTADIARFGHAYLSDHSALPKTVAQFLKPNLVNGRSTYYGLGWQTSMDAQNRTFYGHIGNGVGGYSNFFVYPEQHMAFSILINCTDPKIQDQLDEIIDLLLSASISG